MKLNKISSVVCCVLLIILGLDSPAAQGSRGNSQADVALYTPWKVFENSVKEFATESQSFRQKIEQVSFTASELTWQLMNLDSELNVHFGQVDASQNQFHATADSIRLKLRIGQAKLDQYIEKEVGGVIVRIRIQAICEPIDLIQPQARGEILVHHEFNERTMLVDVENLQLNWEKGSWSVSKLKCTGPSGFEARMQDELAKALNDPESFRPLVKNWLQEKIQTQLSSIVESLKSPRLITLSKESLPLEVSVDQFESKAGGLLTHLSISWKGIPSNQSPLDVSDQSLETLSKSSPSLLISRSTFKNYLISSLQSRPSWMSFEVENQPEFRRLLSSKFLQFFVWPDLMNYSKRSPFQLAVGKPSFSRLEVLGNGALSFDANLVSWFQSVRAGQWWNYLRIDSNISGTVTPEIESGRLNLSSNLGLNGFGVRFGEEYTQTFRPNRYLSSGVARKALTQLLQFPLSVDLPALDLAGWGKARANRLSSVPEALVLSFNIGK